MKPPIVFCLHGFLGQPSDWQFLLGPEQDLYEYVFVDYNHEEALDPKLPLEVWGAQFNKWMKSFGEDRTRHLVGYSLGGRLALHALFNQPELWSKAVFISTHPGLNAQDQKEARLKADTLFAKNIEKESWDKVLASWNSQFKDQQKEPLRDESFFERKTLSSTLKNWSLGTQYNFKESVLSWPVKQLWLAGEQDPRYLEILEEVPVTESVKKEVIPQSSHRVLFEQPEILKKKIESFLD